MANELFAQGRVEDSIVLLKQAFDADPANVEIGTKYYARLNAFANGLLRQAQTLRQQGKLDDAKAIYEKVIRFDASNSVARNGLSIIPREQQQAKILLVAAESFRAGDVDQAMAMVQAVLTENPDNDDAKTLKQDIEDASAAAVNQRQMSDMALALPKGNPITLELRDANIKMVFDVLARSAGVNFILDKDVPPDSRVTVFLRKATIEDAVKLILQTNQLEYKVLNANSVLIYPSTAEKIKVYQDLVVKAFYLQNADVKQVQTNLKAILKGKDTVIDEKLNLLIMRDTPDSVQVAERLIAMQDLKDPEVMLEVEVLEVDRAKITNLGIQWPGSITLTPLGSSISGGLTLAELRNTNSNTVGVSPLAFTVNINDSINNANILANPRIRVKNRESAKIMIGDKLPVITSNVTSTGVVSSNINYLDVGLKLDVQPDIRLRNDIGIKVELEVSSVTNTVTLANGTQTYQIGTRNASTRLRLRDGETQILGGLINNQESTSGNRIPGIGELPGLNRVFGSQRDAGAKTELVLSITPRLIRNLNLPPSNQMQFWSGTEAAVRSQSLFAAMNKVSTTLGESKKTDSEISANPPMPLEPAKNIALSWTTGPKAADGTLLLNLNGKADGAVRSLPMQIGFDPAAYQVLSLEEGNYFKRDIANTTFSHAIDQAGGKIFVTVMRNDVQGASAADMPILSVRVRPTGVGTGELRILTAEPVVSNGSRPVVLLPAPYAPKPQ